MGGGLHSTTDSVLALQFAPSGHRYSILSVPKIFSLLRIFLLMLLSFYVGTD